MKRPSLVEKLVTKLVKLGMTERKAKELAKGLAPTVRSAVKAEMTAKTEPKETVKAVSKPDRRHTPLDLPVLPMEGAKGADLLRVMHGLSSTATYLVAAVKGDHGLIAARKLSETVFNVKFYPTMEFWHTSPEELEKLGAHSFCQRDHYQRMRFSPDGLSQLLSLVNTTKPKMRGKTIIERIKAIAFSPLQQAFTALYSRRAA